VVGLQGDQALARTLLEEGLALRLEVGSAQALVLSLDAFGKEAVACRLPARAVRLFAAAAANREALGAPLQPSDGRENERALASARAALDEAAFAAAWTEGRALSLEHAVEYARAPGEPEAPA
jgi:hypothetical protein